MALQPVLTFLSSQLKTHAYLFTAETEEAEEEIPKMNVPSAAVASVISLYSLAPGIHTLSDFSR
jgi:hypothetical protein